MSDASGPIPRLNTALEGRYRIERQLGEGGMATVYLAEDLKHHRSVALKVLKPELAAVVGAERFLAEIETTANLTHPNILPLFDSGEMVADGESGRFLYYVMPYVEGESLRERLDRERQLPVDEAVGIATNVAEALDYAHRQGVLHRDIKPANILLQDGKPVISDFGIALAVGAAGGGRLTETGLSLGTPHYMSPEQATGDASLSPATDIYALGCVLYEMLVGEPPYTGSTPQAVLGRIMTGEVPTASEERSSVPPHVDAVIRKALEKLPADRFGSTREFGSALGDAGFRYGLRSSASHHGDDSRLWTGAIAGFAVSALVMAGPLLWLLTQSPAPAPATRFALESPEGIEIGPNQGFAISPDGRILVFADDPGGGLPGSLYRRSLGSLEPVAIPDTEFGFNPFFSPDGEWFGYFERPENNLRKMRLDGTESTLLASGIPAASRSAVWGPDGTIVYTSTTMDGLWRVNENGGEAVRVPSTEGLMLYWMGGLPGGEAVIGSVIESDEHRVVAVSLADGSRTELLPGSTPRYMDTGHLVFWREGSLWAVAFDPERLETLSEPARVVSDVGGSPLNGYAMFEAGGGTLLYGYVVRGNLRGGTPVWVEWDGSESILDADLAGPFMDPAISPDGRRVALAEPNVSRRDIWIYDLDQGGTLSRVTSGTDRARQPFWSLDGREVGYSSPGGGLFTGLFARPWNLSAPARVLRPSLDGGVYEGRWTPDGTTLVFRVGDYGTSLQRDLWTAPSHPDSAAVPLLTSPAQERTPAPSPDGRLLAYTSTESGREEVYIRLLDGTGGRLPVSQNGGTNPVWDPSGDRLFYVDTEAMALAEAAIRTDPEPGIESREQHFSFEGFVVESDHPQWDIAPDGRRFLVIRETAESDERIDFAVVENFGDELSRLLPVR